MSLDIIAVEGRAALKRFVRLPNSLYRGMPGFVPHLTMERMGLLDPAKAPFFRHGEAQYWIAERDGIPVGRISAQIDHAQPAEAFGNAGMFGCMDAADDAEAVAALIATAEAWLRGRGKEKVFGPCMLSMNEETGLLVDSFERRPMIMVPWHPPYLEKLILDCGYEPIRDLHFWELPHKTIEDYGGADRVAGFARKSGLTLRSLDRKHASRDIEIMRNVYNDAWRDNWGFVPLQPEDLDGIANDLKPIIPPEAGMIVERDGAPLGVAMVIPNIEDMTHDLGGDPSPLGWLRLGWRMLRRRYRSGRVILFGVAHECRDTVLGALITAMMVAELTARRSVQNLDLFEAGWVLDNNRRLVKMLEQAGAERVRTVRLFDKAL
ncbi:MAG: hypothetical protein H6883_00705 [Rhodobiaceae bacterium]|nr:hypothetical protein [Rhodobiaceae bacterium]MCC0054636.1 hypothetical protein [Rhodobiaceae bacterium]